MLNKIQYEMTWCDYLTDCPYKQKETETEFIKVGSWECNQCPFHINDDHKNKIVICKYDKIKSSCME